MNKTINVGLDTGELTDLVKKLKQLSNDMKKLPSLLAEEVAHDGFLQLNLEYGLTPEDNNLQDINTKLEKTNKGYSIVAEGRDVIYAEFGTGDKGEQTPHPEKGKYNLKAYNSGETIRPADELSAYYGINGGLYWTYVRDGKFNITQGTPAGMQMFKTRNYIRKDGIKKASERLVGDMLSKL